MRSTGWRGKQPKRTLKQNKFGKEWYRGGEVFKDFAGQVVVRLLFTEDWLSWIVEGYEEM